MLEELFDDSLAIDPVAQTAEILKPLPPCKGVILFADENDMPIQLLICANIRRTAAHRLFTKEPAAVKKRADISRIVRRIYYRSSYNDFASSLAHYRIAKVLYPDTYNEHLTLPRQTYVKIDPAAKWPFFSLTDKPSDLAGENVFGLFPSRKAAAEFIQILQDVFCLCQRPRLLASGRDFATCPYLQMATCCAPCVGKMKRDVYISQITDAICAAAGDIEKQTAKLKEKMEKAAHQRLFEQAQSLKKRLERLKGLTCDDYRWTMRLSALTILHIDRSAKIATEGKRKKTRTYAGFLIRAGLVTELGDFRLDEFDKFYKSFTAKLSVPGGLIDPKEPAEHLSLLAWHLYRSKPAGVWLDCSKTRTTPREDEIKNAILERFE
ncbi:MAG: hypothetical protein DRP65_06960 [Planctomycetota bacterium]|nr:MAG: hypothetical protein DRP65_06960 [Planctomycetota bacterium]